MAIDMHELYGSMVFNDTVMQDRLPKSTYKELQRVINDGETLTRDVADEVAHAMKEWAMEKGAAHYTHWFQPLTGITSEKHDSFLTPIAGGRALMRFSGKELIQGEPDASSFPSGGIRSTFEARGYTAWDTTSYAFIKDNVLCIPTAFVSYTGEALDKKTPLLRSMEAVSAEVKRVLKLFGKDVKNVHTTVGPEQEYFLIKEEDYANRLDLLLTGRTLFGAPPCKGQELEDHYFGSIRPTVNRFMEELDTELWKLGIPAKTKHNEVAPAQHELAPIFTVSSAAIDGNLLTMELMRKIASHHGLVCLQHEKPFEGINGSGKHNNWSIEADGENLLNPGKTPYDNLQFLVFLTAVIRAVDEYQGLLRMTIATAGNDHRLGANEAPPAIVSMFLGDELEGVVRAIIDSKEYVSKGDKTMDLGVPALPSFIKDNTDRNRTSPFAFTGNKFEFRMPGAEVNLSDCNMVLNTIVAKALQDYLEAVEGAKDFEKATKQYMKQVLTDHQRIVFNGDGYDDSWVGEAEKRGLLNLKNTPEALPEYIKPASIALFEQFHILNPVEVEARYEIRLDQYSKKINIEAQTALRMVHARYLPAIIEYSTTVAESIEAKQGISAKISTSGEQKLLAKLADGIDQVTSATERLDAALAKAQQVTDLQKQADDFANSVIPAMRALRNEVDAMELIVGHEYWPVPSYNHMLFYT
ncbi:MAG: glutamine synthetase III [Coriobacteriales bacterium]|jgi:glutamine synthetase|nr:glutamine synthetase III [Coriobacteriales bacterium]